MIWNLLDPIFILSALILFPIGSNIILLVLIKDYVLFAFSSLTSSPPILLLLPSPLPPRRTRSPRGSSPRSVCPLGFTTSSTPSGKSRTIPSTKATWPSTQSRSSSTSTTIRSRHVRWARLRSPVSQFDRFSIRLCRIRLTAKCPLRRTAPNRTAAIASR